MASNKTTLKYYLDSLSQEMLNDKVYAVNLHSSTNLTIYMFLMRTTK